MKERIIEFLRAENKSSSQFAEEIGVQPSGISHIISGRNKPSLDFIVKMLEKYSFLSTEWLLFGRGEMYKDQSVRDLFSDPVVESHNGLIINEQLNPVIGKKETAKSDLPPAIVPEGREIHRVVTLFNDGTFLEYKPGRE
jgi:transcriptional regulator with XRE-family HTH domain